MQTELLW